jgi:hypothetical protein
METIIQQIVTKLVKESLNYMEKEGIRSIGKCAKDLLPVCMEAVNELLKALIKQMDEELLSAKKERKLDKLTIKERDVKRTILLDTGSLSYERTYYQWEDGTYLYPVDTLIGVEKSSRMSREIEAQLVGTVAEHSYEKASGIVVNGKLSRQTVKNKVHQLGEVAIIPQKQEVTPEELHLFADEDHVNMQSGKNETVRLITGSEGSEPVCKGRNALKNPIHFEGYNKSPKKQWEYVYAVLDQAYAMEQVKRVVVHGDGASWIDGAGEVFPNLIAVIDPYHLNKYIKQAAAGVLCKYRQSLRKVLKDGTKGDLNRLVGKMFEELETHYTGNEQVTKKKKLQKAAGYLWNNWAKIKARLHSVRVGSCTEPMISHVLSQRLSRNPMGWSKTGLSKVAMLRVYTKNGGTILPQDVRGDKIQAEKERKAATTIHKYDKLVEDGINKVLQEAKQWTWLEETPLVLPKPTGTSVLLKSLGKVRGVC